ncbi:hypothetical protein F2Q68_00015044 [Brassica cretica]|uniref:Uncharacterized protein n=2 Tax=Brassica cretica TaxID=69181 RepID=A0ABQ7F766_BRACR|nr:hypothetical protein F2Q68_00015044 [Brassica cretica]KAF3611475.1 hypothetical protein DY000_02047782 [Brassica cretica]
MCAGTETVAEKLSEDSASSSLMVIPRECELEFSKPNFSTGIISDPSGIVCNSLPNTLNEKCTSSPFSVPPSIAQGTREGNPAVLPKVQHGPDVEAQHLRDQL